MLPEQTELMTITGTTQLKVTWPRLPRPIHDEIIRRLKLINGAQFDKDEACWWVPATQGDKLMDAFPKASYDVDAIYACTDAHSKRTATFYHALVSLGIKFIIDAHGAVTGFGDGVSPLLRELITARADALRPLVLQAQGKAQRKAMVLEPLQSVQSAEDVKWEGWMRGVQNAAVRAERDAARRMPWERAGKKEAGG